MNIIRGLHNLNLVNFSCVTTIGNFDGVHLGHQNILNQLHKKSVEYKLPSLVILFEPHPKEFFYKHINDKSKLPAFPPRLNRFRDKILLLEQHHVDHVLVVHFTKKFASLSADNFVEQILIKQLNVKYVLIGDDFCYGHKRQGNYDHLSKKSKQHNFELNATKTYFDNSERISSTRVRQVLSEGDIDTAKRLLNRPYSISGHIQHGAKKGRTIGFPTANIGLPCRQKKLPALTGVYAVDMCISPSNQKLQGIANIGYRPTIDGKKALLEVNLFDFNDEIYGKYAQVNFLYKIRDEKKFASFEELKKQIEKDVVIAKKWHNTSTDNA